MTIYSQHASRGKVQILATFHGPAGVVSATVTSVDTAALAVPIVDALNRISACATMPVSVWDRRDGQFESYPDDHLAALTDRTARADLLDGAHSLWYEQVKVLLHQALNDLDEATAVVPEPVQKAITAELETEARGLREALAEYSEGAELPDDENRRIWEHEAPFVVPDGGVEGLTHKDREFLDRVEHGISDEQLRTGVADLRLLLDAHARCTNHEAMLLTDDFMISDDPYEFDSDRYFLNVEAPMPDGEHGRDSWGVEILLWVPDDPENEEDAATGEPVLRCTLSAPPAVDEVVELLNRSGGRQEQIAAWAKTPVGEVLDGTAFVVTERY